MNYVSGFIGFVVNVVAITSFSAGVFFALGRFAMNVFALFAPAGIEVHFSYDRETIQAIYWMQILMALQIAKLCCATLWIRRWNGWADYAIRLLRFVGGIIITTVAFVMVGVLCRHVVPLDSHIFQFNKIEAADLPVVSALLGLLTCTILVIVFMRSRSWKK